MILIASAAYIDNELIAEFGKIPPCMLPLANKPLFEWQVKAIRKQLPKERLLLSLPLSYDIGDCNISRLSDLDVEVVNVPDGYSLAESLLFVINTVGNDDDVFRVLHGDTLIEDLTTSYDVLAVASTLSNYAWEIESHESQEEIVWCGYFSFSSSRIFTKYLALSNGDFVAAVRSYDNKKKLNRHYTNQWFDLGHINTYFVSRSKLTTERSFNKLNIEDGFVFKTGSNYRKIDAEINWYLNAPSKIKLRTPQLIEYGNSEGKPYYVLEYLYLTPLNELFVHGRNPIFFWGQIFTLCDSFFEQCIDSIPTSVDSIKSFSYEAVSKDMHNLLVKKTWDRLEEFSKQSEIMLNMPWCFNGCWLPSLNQIADNCMNLANNQACVAGVMHGDFCFSNILFESRSNTIKVVDPRGINHCGEFSIYGDISYDFAKLMHSVIGLYDFILADMYKIQLIDTNQLSFTITLDERMVEIQRLFLESSFAGGRLLPSKVMPQVILLFLSMLSLHADNPIRQLALMANALRLYQILQNKL
jgi:hypothetical protein